MVHYANPFTGTTHTFHACGTVYSHVAIANMDDKDFFVIPDGIKARHRDDRVFPCIQGLAVYDIRRNADLYWQYAQQFLQYPAETIWDNPHITAFVENLSTFRRISMGKISGITPPPLPALSEKDAARLERRQQKIKRAIKAHQQNIHGRPLWERIFKRIFCLPEGELPIH